MNTERPRNETVATLAALVAGEVHGDATAPIRGVADIRTAKEHEIAFCRDALTNEVMAGLTAGAILATEVLPVSSPLILVANPHVAFARIARYLHPTPRATEHFVHPSAVVDPLARLEAPVHVGPHTAIGPETTIAAGTIVHPNVVIGAQVEIGPDCTLHPHATVYDRVKLGARVVVHAGAVLGADGFGYAIESDGTRTKFPQLGDLVLGDDAEIGANSTLDRSALNSNTVGSGTKIDNLCHIGHNCTIGKDTTVSAMSAFAADCHLGDRVVIAGHVVIGGDVHIGNDVTIGGNSAVTSDVSKPGFYAGYPLQPRAKAARTAVLHSQLSRMQSELRELRRRLDEIQGETDSE